MQVQIITYYCFCEDFLRAIEYTDDRRTVMSTSEVMTIAFVAAAYFKGCFELSHGFLMEHGYIKRMLSKSRFNRRIHAIPEWVWRMFWYGLGEAAKATHEGDEYSVDSMPVPYCNNIRISHSKLYKGEANRGKIASKWRYFYGIRIHLLVTKAGLPVEWVLADGSEADIHAFKRFNLDIPTHSIIDADKGYTDYSWEDLLKEDAEITLMALRKKNAKRQMNGCWQYICQKTRKQIEHTFSQVSDKFERSIGAVTKKCFELKCFLFVWVFALTKLANI